MNQGAWIITRREYRAGEKQRLEVADLAADTIYELRLKLRRHVGAYAVGGFAHIYTINPLDNDFTVVTFNMLTADYAPVHQDPLVAGFRDDILQPSRDFPCRGGYFAGARDALDDEWAQLVTLDASQPLAKL